jgi:hypothetical protein
MRAFSVAQRKELADFSKIVLRTLYPTKPWRSRTFKKLRRISLFFQWRSQSQPLQKFRKRSGASSVYRTVC